MTSESKPPAPRSPLSRLFLAPDRRLRTAWRLAGQTLFFFGGAVALLIPATLVLSLVSPDLMEALFLGTGQNAGQAFGGAIQFVAMVGSVYLARRLLDRRSVTSLGLAWGRRAARDLLAGTLIAAPMIGVMFLLEWALGWLQVEGLAWQGASPTEWLPALILYLGVFILVGFAEELIFRGYWLANLAEGLNRPWAIGLSSLAFAVLHIGNPGFGLAPLTGLFLAGLLFAFATYRTGSLWLPIGLHIGWNFFEGPVFGFAVSGLEIFQLVEQTVQGPVLWTGGDFGPEAGLILLPALGVGAALVALYARGETPLEKET